MTFLQKDYALPKTGSRYTKLEKGDTVIRALSSAIVGWQYWTGENKPVRLRENPKKTPIDMREDSKLKHFWAFAVWNYDTKALEVLELTQSSIQKAILSLINDEDWGDPKGYDIKITRTGDGLDTEYAVTPRPKKDIPSEAVEAFESTPLHLEALYEGNNPFEASEEDVSDSDPF
jgi:hypothetical protein